MKLPPIPVDEAEAALACPPFWLPLIFVLPFLGSGKKGFVFNLIPVYISPMFDGESHL